MLYQGEESSEQQTVRFLHCLRVDGTGYTEVEGLDPASLQPTVSVLKALALLGSNPSRPHAVLAFVWRCRDEVTGGFSPGPGQPAKPFTTAFGLLALRELGDPLLAEVAVDAMRLMAESSSTLADYFMAIAAWEECELAGPAPQWAVEAILSMREEDLFWGASRRTNAIAVAALLRAGYDLENREEMRALLLDAQQKDGGFADQPGSLSDLATSYSVMRALRLLAAHPDVVSLRGYLAQLRWQSGGYGPAVGGPRSAGATYQVLGIFEWIRDQEQGSLTPEQAVAAALRGDDAALEHWLKGGGDPDLPDGRGWTPLLAAAARGHASTIELLLHHELGAGVRRASPGVRFAPAGALPLYMAGQNGDLKCVQLLLRACPEHLFATSTLNGHTVLLQAAFFGSAKHLCLATYLLEKAHELLDGQSDSAEGIEEARQRMLRATNTRGANALAIARQWQNRPMIDLFERFDHRTPEQSQMESRLYLNELLLVPPPPARWNAEDAAQTQSELFWQVMQQAFSELATLPPTEASGRWDHFHGRLCALIQSRSFEVNRRAGPLEQPPLVAALTGGDSNDLVGIFRRAIARRLLDAGADPDLPERRHMAVDSVIRAAVLGHFDMLRTLSGYMSPGAFGRALNESPAVNGQTALHDSVQKGLTARPDRLPEYLAQIRWCVGKGALRSIEDYTGQTPEGMARAALLDPLQEENARAILSALGAGIGWIVRDSGGGPG